MTQVFIDHDAQAASRALHEAASFVLERPPLDGEAASGICGLINDRLGFLQTPTLVRELAMRRLEDIMMAWPESTGNQAYPIPATSPHATGITVRQKAVSQYDLIFDRWRGEQRGLRIRLLQYIIAQTAPQEA